MKLLLKDVYVIYMRDGEKYKTKWLKNWYQYGHKTERQHKKDTIKQEEDVSQMKSSFNR